MTKYSHFVTTVTIGLLMAVFLSGNCLAIVVKGEDRVHISNLHEIDDDLYVFGEYITIDGRIEGDICAAGYEVNTNGFTGGSQNIFAYEYRHTGKADGSVRAAGYSITIDGFVGRSLMASGNTVRLNQGSVIAKNVNISSNMAMVAGTIAGKFDFQGSKLYLSGSVNGDVTIEAKEVFLTSPCVINGDLEYCCAEMEIDLDTLQGVTIVGDLRRIEPEIVVDEDEESDNRLGSSVITFSAVLAAFLFGLILMAVFGKYVEASVYQLKTRFAVATATGFVALLALTMAAVFLVIALIVFLIGWITVSSSAAPLGFLMLVFSILAIPILSFATVSGGLVAFTGQIVVAILVGFGLVRIFKKTPASVGRFQLLIGLIVLCGLYAQPFIGGLFYFCACIIGGGGLICGIRSHYQQDISARCAPESDQTASPEPPQ